MPRLCVPRSAGQPCRKGGPADLAILLGPWAGRAERGRALGQGVGEGDDRRWVFVGPIAGAHGRLKKAKVALSQIHRGRRPGTRVASARSHNAGVATLPIGPDPGASARSRPFARAPVAWPATQLASVDAPPAPAGGWNQPGVRVITCTLSALH